MRSRGVQQRASVPPGRQDSVSSQSVTVSWDDLPEWMRDNEYIKTGYRRELGSVRKCLHSVVGYWHNETINITSHWGGAVIVALIAAATYPAVLHDHPTANWKDVFGFYVFLSSAMFCLVCSGAFHCLTCHSQSLAKQWHAMDYTGIVVLTVGSFFPTLYYGFFCDPFFYRLYITSICTAGAFAAYIVLSPTYSTPAYRWARTSVFIALGLGGVVPVVHGLFATGLTRLLDEIGLFWLALSGLLYIAGAVTYASRVPEKWYPGKFDIIGSSHQIFHCAVVAAVIAHYIGVLTAFEHHHGVRGGECAMFQ